MKSYTIDKLYIEKKICMLVESKKPVQNVKKMLGDDNALKRYMPYCIKNSVRNLLNIIMKIHQLVLFTRSVDKGIKIPVLHPMAIDFFKYVMKSEVKLNLGDYYPDSDMACIERTIENKLKCLINGYEKMEETEFITKCILEELELVGAVKRIGSFYCLKKNDISYFLPVNYFHYSVFHNGYGLNALAENVLNMIQGKTILDIGALYGDASLYFIRYKPDKILAYEPVASNFNLLIQTIKKNSLEQVICPVKKAVGHENNMSRMSVKGSISTLNNDIKEPSMGEEMVEITTIDSECGQIDVGLIKIDIEGYEYNALIGAINTIKKHKPILIISMYHTGKDFFEIPPLLKTYVQDYKFRFLDIYPQHPIAEKILVAYVE